MKSTWKTKMMFAGSAFFIGLVATIILMREPMEPLTAESLRRARDQWRRSEMKNYNLRYRMHGSDYELQIREGLITQLRVNGQQPASAQWRYYSMDGLFDTLELEVENLSDPSGPFATRKDTIFARVRFNRELGYIERYLRSSGGFGRGATIEMIMFEQVP